MYYHEVNIIRYLIRLNQVTNFLYLSYLSNILSIFIRINPFIPNSSIANVPIILPNRIDSLINAKSFHELLFEF